MSSFVDKAAKPQQQPNKLSNWSIPLPCLAQRRYVHHLAIVNRETNRNEPSKSSEYISRVAENPTNLSVLDVMHIFASRSYSFIQKCAALKLTYPFMTFMTIKPPQCIGRKCCSGLVLSGQAQRQVRLYAFHSNTAEITNYRWSVLSDAWKGQNPCPSQSSQPSLK